MGESVIVFRKCWPNGKSFQSKVMYRVTHSHLLKGRAKQTVAKDLNHYNREKLSIIWSVVSTYWHLQHGRWTLVAQKAFMAIVRDFKSEEKIALWEKYCNLSNLKQNKHKDNVLGKGYRTGIRNCVAKNVDCLVEDRKIHFSCYLNYFTGIDVHLFPGIIGSQCYVT